MKENERLKNQNQWQRFTRSEVFVLRFRYSGFVYLILASILCNILYLLAIAKLEEDNMGMFKKKVTV